MKKADVIIIGAGAAGLACAARLKRAGKRVIVLEARDRIGGRAFSFQTEQFVQPIEFGAEFIHGAPRILISLFESLGKGFNDVSDRHLYFARGKLREEVDFWERLQKVTNRLNPNQKTDRSVRDFLEAHRKHVPREVQKIFTAYVEGFQAANLDVMGERALAKTEQDEEANLNGSELFRPSAGYTDLFERFVREEKLVPNIRLQNLVRHVHWKKNRALVHSLDRGKKVSYSARRIVVTVPLGVLKENHPTSSIEFIPRVPSLDLALAGLHMGHVQRLTFHFKTRFWEAGHKEPVGFMHAGPEHAFPAWWTQMPVRSPLLVAWQGGPRAESMGKLPVGERVGTALNTLAQLTGRTSAFLKKEMVAYYTHNWSQDPYALGAYSYTGIASKEHASLESAVEGTVYFAGEASAKASAQGTVHGALQSGETAARKILARGGF